MAHKKSLSPMTATRSALDTAIADSLTRRRHSSTLRRLTLPAKESVDFSSNDFLSLSTSSELRRRYLAELSSCPDFPLGSGGSRLLDGNTNYAEALESQIAAFHGASTALLANSGFDANSAIFSTLPQPGDLIVYDALIHASVHDGMRASRVPTAHRFSFQHNDVDSFASILRHLLTHSLPFASGRSSLFVALEAIYSMDGDVAPLSAIISTIDTLVPAPLRRNIHLVVDEAHATGVLGPRGSGLVCSLNLESRISVRLHTFGKALGAHGAAILCSQPMKEYLINYARPLIYTTFMPFPTLALVRAAYSMLQDGVAAESASRLSALGVRLWTGLKRIQARYPPTVLYVGDDDTACPVSPIFSLRTSQPRLLAAACQEAGYLVRPIMPPTVPTGSERVRVCLHAGNTESEVDGLLDVVGRWCEGIMATAPVEERETPSSSTASIAGGDGAAVLALRAKL